LSFLDLLASCDVLITKVGYGSFVEAAAHAVPVLYLDRPDWPETPYLAAWLAEHGNALSLDEAATILRAPDREILQVAVAASPARPAPEGDWSGAGRAPFAGALGTLILGVALGGFSRDFGMHLRHVDFLGACEQIVETAGRQCARLSVDDDFLAEDHQGGNGTNLEMTCQGLMFFSIHLGKRDAFMFFGRSLENRCETFARSAPGRPEVDYDKIVVENDFFEILLIEFQDRHEKPL
jgi:hypothetical protein